MYPNCKANGFTLFELIVSISILSIIAMLAIPHYHELMERQEVSNLKPLLHQHISVAKNHAKTLHSNIVLCSSVDLKQCENDQWNFGIIIFNDLNKNKKVDENELIVAQTATQMKYGQLRWKGSASNPKVITFQGDSGLPRGAPGSFFYCGSKNPQNHKRFYIGPMGHVRVEPTTEC